MTDSDTNKQKGDQPGDPLVGKSEVGKSEVDKSEVEETQGDAPATDVSETVEANTEVEESAEQVVVKAKGRGIAFFAILLSLGALAAVGYVYYLLVYLDPLSQLRSDKAVASEQTAALSSRISTEISALREHQEEVLNTALAKQSTQMSENEDAVLESLQEALLAAPPSQREWKLAEAEYLLRIANHRVLMEQDSSGALQLLQVADGIIAELDDFSLHPVRARLADEIIALRQVPRDDLQGIYLQIEALKAAVDALPFALPEYVEKRQQAVVEETVWARLGRELQQFIRVRSLSQNESIKPLLAPDEEQYLELNIRLAFEQAQLATLKRHQVVFEHALQSVNEWLKAYLDTDNPKTQIVIDGIDALLEVNLSRSLPDISGSLNELKSSRRSNS